MFASSSHEATKYLIHVCWNVLLCKPPRKFVGRFWNGPNISYAVWLSKPCARILRSLSLIGGASTLSNTLSIYLTQISEHSFLNIDLLTNPNISGKSERRWKKNIPSPMTTTISGLFKTLDFSSSFINVLL